MPAINSLVRLIGVQLLKGYVDLAYVTLRLQSGKYINQRFVCESHAAIKRATLGSQAIGSLPLL